MIRNLDGSPANPNSNITLTPSDVKALRDYCLEELHKANQLSGKAKKEFEPMITMLKQQLRRFEYHLGQCAINMILPDPPQANNSRNGQNFKSNKKPK